MKPNRHESRIWSAKALLAVLAVLLLSAAAFSRDREDREGRNERWIAAWQGTATPGGTFYSPGCPSDVGLTGQTVRNIVFLSAGGESIRVHISNAGGSVPLKIGSASVAISAGGAAAVPQSLHALHFAGASSIVIAAGGEAVSDPVDLAVHALDTLALTIYLPGPTGPTTQHYFAAQTNYLAAGDQSATDAATPFTHKISCWMFAEAVDVKASRRVLGNLIALGDSITDGYLSTTNANHRYPDFLARKLAARNGLTLSVSNSGIIGNELLTIRPQLQFGYPTPARFARDVQTQAGAVAVILLEGINDIGDRSAKAEDLIPVDLQLILAAHASGLKIYGATLVPFAGSNKVYGGDYGTPAGEAERLKLNEWIRSSGAFDGVIDFDAALRDPANPSQLLPAYDGDHLHPNDAGYQAMANAVDLDAILRDVLESAAHDR